MHFLHNTDELGFSFKNRGSFQTLNSEVATDKLKQIPEILEVVNAAGMTNLLPVSGRSGRGVGSWDDKPADAERIDFDIIRVSPEYNAFYEFRLLAGEMLTDDDPDSLVLINESAVRALGWYDAVGKRFDRYTVNGVIRDVYYFAPTVRIKPTYYEKPSSSNFSATFTMPDGSVRQFPTTVLFKYSEGSWKTVTEKIEQLANELSISNIFNAEEIYADYLKSEKALIKLLSLVSAICVLICIFGFVSLVSLTCEERRKSIAIRKINGATAGDILAMFAKEYFLLLFIGAVIAFPIGHYIMQRWLEHYVKQTSMPIWIYLSIMFVLALVIVLCVGWQVYRSSIENPAEVVKSE
jgi:ABC-type antimicrobial peptide transport system permease subunit